MAMMVKVELIKVTNPRIVPDLNCERFFIDVHIRHANGAERPRIIYQSLPPSEVGEIELNDVIYLSLHGRNRGKVVFDIYKDNYQHRIGHEMVRFDNVTVGLSIPLSLNVGPLELHAEVAFDLLDPILLSLPPKSGKMSPTVALATGFVFVGVTAALLATAPLTFGLTLIPAAVSAVYAGTLIAQSENRKSLSLTSNRDVRERLELEAEEAAQKEAEVEAEALADEEGKKWYNFDKAPLSQPVNNVTPLDNGQIKPNAKTKKAANIKSKKSNKKNRS